MKNFYSIVSDMNNEDLNNLTIAIKNRRSVLSMEKRNTVSVGDPIRFIHKGMEYVGTVTSMGRTRVSVKTNRGSFVVPANMLELN